MHKYVHAPIKVQLEISNRPVFYFQQKRTNEWMAVLYMWIEEKKPYFAEYNFPSPSKIPYKTVLLSYS
jgi:hypothetical protein